jgi:hypothetical protein
MSRALRLTLPAPEIIEAILDGRQPERMRLDDLLTGLPLEWEEQRVARLQLEHRPDIESARRSVSTDP